MTKIAIVQIRGGIGVKRTVKDTLKFLKLQRKNSCVVVDPSESIKGMILKSKDYITWGELDKDTLKLLLEKRGKIAGNKPLTEEYLKKHVKKNFDELAKEIYENKIKFKEVPGLKRLFRLHPPVKGFEREGIKKPFSLGGALGYRHNKINDLIKRML